MVDIYSPLKRSLLMARIGPRDSKPERIVRAALRKLGYGRRYRMNVKSVKGRPDFAFVRLKKAIFVHGCFWHQHPRCKRARLPESNLQFWKLKLRANAIRDREIIRYLNKSGWKCHIIWECEMKDSELIRVGLGKFLSGKRTLR